MSDTLTWLLTKKSSSFRVKRNCGNKCDFSTEKFNLLKKNCRQYSGLANFKAVTIALNGNKIELRTKNEQNVNKPAATIKECKKLPIQLGKAKKEVYQILKENNYRPDLQKAVLGSYVARKELRKRKNKLQKIAKKDKANKKPVKK